MSTPASINKKLILTFLSRYVIVISISISALYLFIIYFAESNVSSYLKNQKKEELANITKSVYNEILSADYRTARNKLSLLKGPNTFNSYKIISSKNETIDMISSTDHDHLDDDVLTINVLYPGTNILQSQIEYKYQLTNFNYTKNIFYKYMLIFLSIFAFILLLSIFFIIKYINRIATEYELQFTSILKNPKSPVKINKNPLLPSIMILKHNLLEIDDKSQQIWKLETDKIRFELAKKIAHDIRSPISTLNLISTKIEDSSIKELQSMVVQQINNIANNLLEESKTITNLNKLENSGIEIAEFTNNIQSEFEFKKSAFKQSINFQIEKDTNRSIYLSREQQGVLYSNINNFIQNSIEATDPNGLIEVILRSSNRPNKTYEIVVKDNGKGIPDHILQKLGNEAISYGKDNNNIFNSGNGIALFNAKKDLKNINADLEIKSILNVGTEVIIYI